MPNRPAKRVALLLGAAIAAALAAGPSAAQTQVSTVMSGLDNPRGLALGHGGALYVVEAGSGGSGPCTVLRGAQVCYGPSGAVSRLWHGQQSRIVTGLPSYATPGAGAGVGANDIAFLGNGQALVVIGTGADPALRDAFGPAGQQFGTLVQILPNGRWRTVADVSAHETGQNPDGATIDTNPFGLLAEPGGSYVADAGANALLRVRPNGQVETVTTFDARETAGKETVPTAVVRGPDGALYVSELGGQPFLPGSASIHRIHGDGSREVFASGFKTIIDIDFDPDGNLYVLEYASGPMFFASPGRLSVIDTAGNRATLLDDLQFPTSVLAAPDGTLYVTNNSVQPGAGEVLRVEL